MGSNVSYEEAKQVAEASRETTWELPSFGKGLFLGDLQLDLIHPQPELSEESVRKGEAFLENLKTVLSEHCDPLGQGMDDVVSVAHKG